MPSGSGREPCVNCCWRRKRAGDWTLSLRRPMLVSGWLTLFQGIFVIVLYRIKWTVYSYFFLEVWIWMAESTSSDRSKRQGDCFFLQPHIFGFVVHRWRSGAWSIFQRYKERIWRQTFYSSKTFVSSPKHLNNDILCQKRLELQYTTMEVWAWA